MRPRPPTPDMNVTPLVDVVLVLLIIFMVIVPQMAAGATVDVPGAENFDPSKPEVEPFTLSITKSGTIYIEKSRMEPDEVIGMLRTLHKADPYRRMRIKGDKDAPYGYVRTAFKVSQEVGFPGVGLQVGDMKEARAE